jgi:acetyltransferase-like isoleucine patch superfamily enzyme
MMKRIYLRNQIKDLIENIAPETWYTWILRLFGLRAEQKTKISIRASLRNFRNHSYGKRCVIHPMVTIWCGKLKAGDSVIINPGAVLYGNISIGSFSMIAPNVMIASGEHKHESTKIPMLFQGDEDGEIIIGEDTWLGAGCVILNGVEIGKGCIIGAGTIVTKSTPEYSIVVGNPGRIIGYRNQNSSE